MHKTISRIKSLVLGGAVAVSALAAPLSSNMMTPSLTATAADTDDYARLLQYSLYFYDANMCGNEVQTKGAMSWRGNCHTTDEVVGGFHDAGDHAMFGLPQGYSAATLGWSYYEFKDAFDTSGQSEHLKMITDHFCDFFKRSTKLNGDSVSNFLYQKGDGNEDHGYWGPPENQGGRKMFWTSNGASDIAAEYAAALAVNYINFGNSEDLKYAKALYKFSTQYNQCATYGPQGFYDSKVCADEQAWAAGWLYLATKEGGYLNDLKSKLPEIGWVHGWNDAHLGAACLLGHATGDWSKANGYIGSKANGSGYFFLDKWGSARINCSMQLTALVVSKNTSADYTSWAKGQMNYILGQNPANTCFVTGFAPNSTKYAHHRAASGYTSYEQFNMNNWDPNGDHMSPYCGYSSNSHLLVGALVGGPCDAGGTYHDNMADYICNEVAIDYNAGLVGAAAGLYDTYKTGKTASSIEGVTKIYSGSVTPGPGPQTTTTTTGNKPQTTTTTTAAPGPGPGPSNKDIVLSPSDMSVGTEKGDDGETNNYAEFAPQGAKSATLYYKVNSNDTESSGGFGTWTGKWDQVDFKVNVPSDKVVAVDYEIPSNVGQTVKAMIWWPHGNGVTIEKVVLHMENAPEITTTTTTTTTKTTTTSTTTTATTTTTAVPPVPGGLPGDANCNGEVRLNDAVLIMQAIGNPEVYGLNGSNTTHITAQGIINGDVSGNGDGLTNSDALTIQKYLIGLIPNLNAY